MPPHAAPAVRCPKKDCPTDPGRPRSGRYGALRPPTPPVVTRFTLLRHMWAAHYWHVTVVLLAVAIAFLTTAAVGGGAAAWFVLTVWPASVTAAVYVAPTIFVRYRRRVSDNLAPNRGLVVSVASAFGGTVFVALAVLVATVDAATWGAVVATGQVGELVLAPSFTWAASLSTVAWVWLGSVVHAFTPSEQSWDPLRYTAAVVATSATYMVPLALPIVGYQVWRLVDVNIAGTATGL